jgi:hypothetical protein
MQNEPLCVGFPERLVHSFRVSLLPRLCHIPNSQASNCNEEVIAKCPDGIIVVDCEDGRGNRRRTFWPLHNVQELEQSIPYHYCQNYGFVSNLESMLLVFLS